MPSVMQICITIGLMTTLTITSRGQVTFRREILDHLGIGPGDRIDLDLLPDGRAVIHAARPEGSMKGFVGVLAGRTGKVATLEEIEQAASEGWAGRR
jgi:bifunctional DNA-binding transcriptional regulator/antitoxin component of YhaV-PrlF toxin-antitoxin module